MRPRPTHLRPSHLVFSYLVLAPLILFIAVPIGAVLLESFRIAGPMLPPTLYALTSRAVDRLPAGEQTAQIETWVESLTPRERMEASAASLSLIGKPVPWDRKANFDQQIEAAGKAVAALSPGERKEFDARYPLAAVMLHKRIPLAFKVRDRLSEREFVELRTGEATRYGLDHYLAFLHEPRIRNAAVNSFMLAAIACAVVVPLAFLLAYGVNRRAVPWPRAMRFVILVPLVSPPVIMAFSALLLFGRQGLITKELLDGLLGLIDAARTNIYGFKGVVLAQVLSFTPPAFIILDNVLSRQDGRLDEAAASQGASAWQTFAEVTLPCALPGLVRAFILVFILSMTDFGNPLVIGKDIQVVAGVIYDEMIGFCNTPLSSALCVWLLLPAGVMYWCLSRLLLGKRRFVSAGDLSAPPSLCVPVPARAGLSVLALGYAGLVFCLYAAVVAGSFTRVWGQDYSFTLAHFLPDLAVTGFISTHQGMGVVWESLMISAIGAPIGGLMAILAAFVIERLRPPGGAFLNFVVLLPAILPGVIFGVGYLVAFNYPFGQKSLALTGTSAILVTNILFGNMFVGVLAARSLLQRFDASIEEAAESLGANLVQRLVQVVFPMLRHALVLGGLYVFVDGLTTLSSVIFLVSPDHMLASVAIFDFASGAYYGLACSKSTVILCLVALVMLATGLFERLGPRRVRALAPRSA